MNIIKKITLLIIMLLGFSLSSYAIEYSIGASWQAGFYNTRGQGYSSLENAVKTISSGSTITPHVFLPITLNGNINFMVEFLPFFALETGFEYNQSVLTIFDIREGGNIGDILGPLVGFAKLYENAISRVSFGVPIMLRGQYEWDRVLVYASIGPKIYYQAIDYIRDGSGKIASELLAAENIENRNMTIDIGFATGIEFRVGHANYIGLRASYNLNVLAPATFNGRELYHDNYGFGITYRYAFNSKWKINC